MNKQLLAMLVSSMSIVALAGCNKAEAPADTAADVAKGPMWRRGLDSLLHLSMKWMR